MQGLNLERDDWDRSDEEVLPNLPDPTVESKIHDLTQLWRDLGGSD